MSPLIERLRELERRAYAGDAEAARVFTDTIGSLTELAEALHNALVLVNAHTGADDAIANATLDAGNAALANLARRLNIAEEK